MNVHLDLVIANELELLTPECRRNPHRVAELLHPDFLEQGASGRVWTRAETLDMLEDDPAQAGVVTDMHAAALAPDIVLVTYRLEGPRPSLRSSVWVQTDGRWQVRFHQGTLSA